MPDIKRIPDIRWEPESDEEGKKSGPPSPFEPLQGPVEGLPTGVPISPLDLITGLEARPSGSGSVPSKRPDVTSERAGIIRSRFQSFNPFYGIDADLSYEEGVELLRNRATLTKLSEHFAQRASEINSLLNKARAHPEESRSYGREAARVACTTLEQVLEARYLREGIKLLAWTRNRHLDEVVAVLTRDIEAFFEEEKKLLVELGISDELASKIVTDCREVFENVRNGKAPRVQVLEAIARIKGETCDLAEKLREEATQERSRESKMKIVKAASKAIGGAAVFFLNTGMFAGSMVSPAFATVSGLLAGGLIEAAAQDL